MLSSWFSRKADKPQSRSGATPRRAKNAPPPQGAWCWFRRAGMAALVLAGTAIGGVVWARGSVFLYRSDYFKIKSVRIYGLSSEMDREIVESARLNSLESRNLIMLNARSLEKRLNGHPKITAVKVTKRFPDTLWIAARERRPVALSGGSVMYAIDGGGYLLEPLGASGSKGADYPFITGLDLEGLGPGDRIESEALTRALDLLARTQSLSPSLYTDLSEISIDEDGGLTLLLSGGVEARLGSADPLKRMPILEAFLKRKPGLEAMTYIDLRFENHFVYK